MAITDGKIVAIEHGEDVINKYISKQVYDAEGKTIIPGFIDAHAHLYSHGLKKFNVNLVGSESVDEVLQRILDFHKENPDRKSTRLNSSHVAISYAVFCLKKKNTSIEMK